MAIYLRRRLKVGSLDGGTTPPSGLAAWQEGYAFYQGGVTGGFGGSLVHVYNYADLKSALQSTSAMVIIVHGQINGTSATINYGYTCQSNKTLIGAPNAIINGFYIGWTDKTNVIVRNLKFQGMPDFDAAGVSKRDYLTFRGTTRFVVNHCHFMETVGTDSHLDCTLASDYFTISDCLYYQGDKGTLIGAADYDPTEVGKLHASLFRNRWVDVSERQPSYRGGTYCHVMNNLYESPTKNGTYDYAIASRTGATVRADNNDFSEYNGFALYTLDSAGGDLNYGDFSGINTNIYGSYATLSLHGVAESSWIPPYEYNSFKIPVANVKAIVRESAGATLTLAQMGY